MNLIFTFVSILLVALAQAETTKDLAGLRECGNLHRMEFHAISGAKAEFSNSECSLKCSIGNTVLSNGPINQGFPCPANAHGICRAGQCEEIPHDNSEALRECGNLHHLDFSKQNGTSTSFISNAGCFLKCSINDHAVSENNLSEGLPCPQNPVGTVCNKGHCQWVPTTPRPTTPAPVQSILKNFKIDQLNVTILSTNFNYEESFLMAQACLQYKKHDACLRDTICLSGVSTNKSSNHIWNKHCTSWSTDSMEYNYIHLFIFNEMDGTHRVGGYVEQIWNLIDRHYTEGFTNPTATTFENSFESKYPVYLDEENSGVRIGDFVVQMYFKFSKRV